jgi:hypothetical protein
VCLIETAELRVSCVTEPNLLHVGRRLFQTFRMKFYLNLMGRQRKRNWSCYCHLCNLQAAELQAVKARLLRVCVLCLCVCCVLLSANSCILYSVPRNTKGKVYKSGGGSYDRMLILREEI